MMTSKLSAFLLVMTLRLLAAALAADCIDFPPPKNLQGSWITALEPKAERWRVLSWEAVPYALGYEVYGRLSSETNAPVPLHQFWGSNTTNITLGPFSSHQQFDYWVKPFGGCATSFAGPVMAGARELPKINNVRAVQQNESNNLITWEAAVGTNVYEIFRAPVAQTSGPEFSRIELSYQILENPARAMVRKALYRICDPISQYCMSFPSSITNVQVGETTGAEFLDTLPPRGAFVSYTYYIKIKGSGHPSDPVSLAMSPRWPGCDIPERPGNVQASQGTVAEGIRVTWDAAPGAEKYEVYIFDGQPSAALNYSLIETTDLFYTHRGGADPGQKLGFLIASSNVCGRRPPDFGTASIAVGWLPSPMPGPVSITPATGLNDRVALVTVRGGSFLTAANLKLTRPGQPDLWPIALTNRHIYGDQTVHEFVQTNFQTIDAAWPYLVLNPRTTLTAASDSEITAVFDLNGAAAGKWNVVVENLEKKSQLTDAFGVEPGFATVYASTFDGQAGAVWSKSATNATPSGERFLGEFGSETITLALDNLPPHTKLRLDLDLLILKTWDGNGDACCGPDTWRLEMENGPVLVDSSFSNLFENRQAYPHPFPFGNNPPRAAAAANDTLGYSQGDSTYKLALEFPHAGSNLVLKFVGTVAQGIEDESWGLDNIKVRVAGQNVEPLPLPEVEHKIYLWTGAAGADPNNWDHPGNWTPNGIPSGNDIAVMGPPAASGTVNASGKHSIYRIDLQGASARLNAAEMYVARLNYGAGFLSGNILIPIDGSMVIAGSGDHDIPGLILRNHGRVAWINGRVRGGGAGTQIFNHGIWDIQTGSEMNGDYGGAGMTFQNRGILLKSAGADSTIPNGVQFVNSATVEIQTNALVLHNGGLVSDGAIFIGAGETRLANGRLTAEGTILSSNLVQTGGTLAGNHTFQGVFTWSAGNWNSVAATTIASNAVLVIQTSADHDLSAHTLTNFGNVLWTGGRIRGGETGSRIYNLGTWEVRTGSEFNGEYGGNGLTFYNEDRFVKSAGVDTAIQGGADFINHAAVEVRTNALVFNNGGLFHDGSSFTGTGECRLGAGTFAMFGTILSSNLVQTGGTLAGNQTFHGLLVWSAGNWNSDGATTIAPTAVLRIQTGADHDLAAHTLTNYGNVLWTGGRVRGGAAGSRIYNLGAWDVQTGSELNGDYGVNGLTFYNENRFVKSAGGSTVIQGGADFVNNAVVEVRINSLVFNNGGLFQNGSSFTGPGETRLAGGRFTLSGAILSSNLVQTGGTLAGNQTFQGVFTWSAGNWNSDGATTIAPNAVLRIQTGADHDLAGHTLTNHGAVLWTDGRIRGGGPITQIYNFGLWDAQHDSEINGDFGGNGLTLYNAGRFQKSAGLGDTTLRFGVRFNNVGILDAKSGVVALAGDYDLALGVLNFGLQSDTRFGKVSFADAARLAGGITATMASGYSPVPGAAFTVLNYRSVSGAFSATNLPVGWTWLAQADPAAYTLKVLSVAPREPLIVRMAQPVIRNNEVQLGFVLQSGSASFFRLTSSTNATGPFTLDFGAVLTTETPGRFYRFTTAASESVKRFYLIEIP